MKFFYARVSTEDQNIDRQIEAAKRADSFDEVFIDKASGKNTNRPKLKKMLDKLRTGDSVTVLSIDRLGRNTRDILNIVQQIRDKGCMFKCLEPNFNTNDKFGEFFLIVLGAISEMERKMILERQRQGIAIARQYGRYKGRKRKELPEFEGVYKQWAEGNKITANQAAKLLDVSRSTFYRRVKKREDKNTIDI